MKFSSLRFKFEICFRAPSLPVNTNQAFEKLLTNNLKEGETNSALLMYNQAQEAEPRLRVIFKLLHNIIEEPLFDQLRTTEQLGYIVSGLIIIIN